MNYKSIQRAEFGDPVRGVFNWGVFGVCCPERVGFGYDVHEVRLGYVWGTFVVGLFGVRRGGHMLGIVVNLGGVWGCLTVGYI
jgi:hypothetical protein